MLALVTSFLYYLPAFFLQKFVAFLEHSPKRAPGDDAPRSLAWGYAFCLGLLVAALLDAVVGGQLWFGEFVCWGSAEGADEVQYRTRCWRRG